MPHHLISKFFNFSHSRKTMLHLSGSVSGPGPRGSFVAVLTGAAKKIYGAHRPRANLECGAPITDIAS